MGLAVPAWPARCGERGSVLMLLHRGGLARRALVQRGPGADQVLAANPDGGEGDKQGEQRDSRRGEEPADMSE